MEILDAADLASLLERIAQAPALREHHVWEAARCLSIEVRDRRAGSSTRRFAELTAADAMLDAVMMLTAMSKPRRFVTSIRNVEGRWLCTVQVAPTPDAKDDQDVQGGTCRPSRRDPDAVPLILPERPAAVPSAATPPPQGQCSKRLEHHDT